MVHAHPKGRMKMGKRIFRLQLDDHAMPGFASGHKDYFGTLDMIEGFINAIRNDEQFAERYQNLVSFFDRYKAGETDIEHSIAYGAPRPLLVRTRCIAERRSVLTNHKWEHLNIWQWPYDMKCKVADCQHVWLTCHKRFMRCIKVEFTNLKYQHLHGEWDHPGFLLGYPHMIEVEGKKTYNRLYIVEKYFKNRGELLADIELFDRKPDPNFKEVLNDIFGDG